LKKKKNLKNVRFSKVTSEKLWEKNFLQILFYVLDQSEHSKGLKMAAKDFAIVWNILILSSLMLSFPRVVIFLLCMWTTA
jgi:hypothetical protein